jgi:hypothetical protein
MKAAKPKRRKLGEMSFDEGLARLIQTKPEEVKPPPGKKRKVPKAAKRLAAVGQAKRSSPTPSHDTAHKGPRRADRRENPRD